MTIAPEPLVASADRFEGVPVMSGGVVSRTVTLKLAVAVLLAASVAEQFTWVVPMAKVLPDVGEHVTVGLAGAASVAVTL